MTVGLLTNSAATAAATLTELMAPGVEPKVRLAAASKVLATLAPISELHELRREIQEFERATKAAIGCWVMSTRTRRSACKVFVLWLPARCWWLFSRLEEKSL